ncbi:hypothetical protein C8R44DRAFT_901550 [Mycena epipterygia]|nr:hypothetical protein C8R44DRAFT_901550 [Mycena epipterygia]
MTATRHAIFIPSTIIFLDFPEDVINYALCLCDISSVMRMSQSETEPILPNILSPSLQNKYLHDLTKHLDVSRQGSPKSGLIDRMNVCRGYTVDVDTESCGTINGEGRQQIRLQSKHVKVKGGLRWGLTLAAHESPLQCGTYRVWIYIPYSGPRVFGGSTVCALIKGASSDCSFQGHAAVNSPGRVALQSQHELTSYSGHTLARGHRIFPPDINSPPIVLKTPRGSWWRSCIVPYSGAVQYAKGNTFFLSYFENIVQKLVPARYTQQFNSSRSRVAADPSFLLCCSSPVVVFMSTVSSFSVTPSTRLKFDF